MRKLTVTLSRAAPTAPSPESAAATDWPPAECSMRLSMRPKPG